MRLVAARVDLEHLIVLGRSIVRLAAAIPNHAEGHVRLGVIRLDRQRRAAASDGFVRFPLLGEDLAKVVIGHPTLAISGDRGLVERLLVGV